jgi:hypothetical protein
MDAFLISKLAFLAAVGVVSFAVSTALGRLFAKQPESLRVALWWLLAVILALSCAWVNGGWPFPPRESHTWVGYVLLFAALLRVRAPLLLAIPLLVTAVLSFFSGSAMLAELAVAGAIAVGAAYLAVSSSALGRGFVEITLLFHFLLLLNCSIYADLPPGLAWLQWIVPAVVILVGRLLQKRMTRRWRYIVTMVSLVIAECGVGILFYWVVRPTVPF